MQDKSDGSEIDPRFEALKQLAESVYIVPSEKDKMSLVQTLKACAKPTTLAFVNAHAFNLCWTSTDTRQAFKAADIVLRDGKGLEILFQKAGKDPGLNMNGTDFIPNFLNICPTKRLAVYGTKEPWLSKACDRFNEEGKTVVSRLDGFQSLEAYIEDIRKTEPEIILLAQGMPRQEMLADKIKLAFPDQPILIICGGAIVDFLADRFERAPLWMQKLGLEWAYRLLREPKRLFRRYVIGNITFLLRAQKLSRVMSS
tara:strand:- start:14476 stop:15243 length:768 start_codon:yes stop_codon:yes gene_type:complete